MSILESLFVGVFGMAVVFVVLVGLNLLLRLQSALITRFSQKKSAKTHVSEAAEAALGAAQAQTDELEGADVSRATDVPVGTQPCTQVPVAARMPVVATMAVRAPASMPIPAPAFHTRPSADGNNIVIAPVAGTVIEIMTVVGARVKRGDLLLLLEAMKMENGIAATRDGTVTHILTVCGKSVIAGKPLVVIQ